MGFYDLTSKVAYNIPLVKAVTNPPRCKEGTKISMTLTEINVKEFVAIV